MNLSNLIVRDTISIREIIPFSVTMNDLTTAADNAIASALRYDLSNPADAGTDISSKVAIATNVVSVNNVWAAGDTATPGTYLLRIVARNAASTIKQEVNIIQKVI